MSALSISIPYPKRTSASQASDGSSAAALAKKCSQPCPPGDFVKAAIGRAADRSGLPFNRVRDIWYEDARRIEAWEMERLRSGADEAEVDIALAGLEVARRRLQTSISPLSREAIAAFDRAVRILGRGADAPRRRTTARR